MGITVKIFSKTNAPLSAVILKLASQLSEKHTETLAEATKDKLIETIDETRVRVSKTEGYKLKDAIEVEKIQDGYGVGKFETLNKKTPWWAWINYGRAFSGREIPPGTKEFPGLTGHFEPNQKGLFKKGQPKFPIDPKKPIAAHNYIEKSLSFIYSQIKNSGLLK